MLTLAPGCGQVHRLLPLHPPRIRPHPPKHWETYGQTFQIQTTVRRLLLPACKEKGKGNWNSWKGGRAGAGCGGGVAELQTPILSILWISHKEHF